ncbi:MAG: RNA-binding S4 domain-containing protein [Bacteroidales bacterium]|nr:RNA-binding S4 domain-containing protein [Bacteroidales bacterium]
MDDCRIDKYLWAIRVFKTRSDATEACKGGRVKVGNANAKPSRAVSAGDVIQVRKGAVMFTYKVIRPVDNRVGAKLVPDFAENLTPESEMQKLRAPVETFFISRDRGAGRPTKKDRREIEHMWDAIDFSVDDDED